MIRHRTDPATPASDQLHPWIYRTIIGLTLVLVGSAWGFFENSTTGFALAVVSLFFFVAVAIPAVLWQIGRNHRDRRSDEAQSESFSAWRSRDFAICEGRVSGAEAAIEVLLPVAAVALGLAAFALVLHFSVGA